ncbi:hypothetical protein E5Q_02478 [Mixia osmundae IAM 14324]|uniref:UDENN domain-containing protein n=1 Tax=Mixia osmundae (strain CBS 9802 / IAM 14324 / JCM 22182 / KY 12970) TaxID=764103 RepID=G7DZ11_MIXOS|nr:hypothetical protein E5Q_02478 [Mixia osmundae IAM 14324]
MTDDQPPSPTSPSDALVDALASPTSPLSPYDSDAVQHVSKQGEYESTPVSPSPEPSELAHEGIAPDDSIASALVANDAKASKVTQSIHVEPVLPTTLDNGPAPEETVLDIEHASSVALPLSPVDTAPDTPRNVVHLVQMQQTEQALQDDEDAPATPREASRSSMQTDAASDQLRLATLETPHAPVEDPRDLGTPDTPRQPQHVISDKRLSGSAAPVDVAKSPAIGEDSISEQGNAPDTEQVREPESPFIAAQEPSMVFVAPISSKLAAQPVSAPVSLNAPPSAANNAEEPATAPAIGEQPRMIIEEPAIESAVTPSLQDPLSAAPQEAIASAYLQSSSSSLHPGSPAPSPSPSASSQKELPYYRYTKPPRNVWGIVVVGMHHALGPVVEYSWPPLLAQDEMLQNSLPFLALPDGAHLVNDLAQDPEDPTDPMLSSALAPGLSIEQRDEDYTYFHLVCPSVSPSTIFGISCNRQLPASQLLNRDASVTRSTVQKAVVVLASMPVFGPIRDKLGVITRAYFAQRDFSETAILVDFYDQLENSLGIEEDVLGDEALYMATSIRELIQQFRFKTLMLLKLLLLQRKVMFYGNTVERLCNFQYSLISMVPLLLLNLEDAATPELDERAKHMVPSSTLKTSDKLSLLHYTGHPLNIFGRNAFFQPYLPLQQIDMLKTDSYLVGTTNSIFQQQRDCKIDVLVNIETAHLEFLDPTIAPLVNLTPADRRWMDDVVRTVSDTWNANDPSRPLGMQFTGSDDFLRAKFEEYICSALSAIKFRQFIDKNPKQAHLETADLHSSLASYNEAWITAFRATPACKLWNLMTDPALFDLIEPKHPCEGQARFVDDVGLRLVEGVHDLKLEENLAPAREAISKGISTGAESIWRVYSNIRNDLSRRQEERRVKAEPTELKPVVAPPATTIPEAVKAVTTPVAESTDLPPPPPPANTKPGAAVGAQVYAGVSEASIRASTIASSFGSFLSSRRAQLWASKPQPALQQSEVTSVPVEPSPTVRPSLSQRASSVSMSVSMSQGRASSFFSRRTSSDSFASRTTATSSSESTNSSPRMTLAEMTARERAANECWPEEPAAHRESDETEVGGLSEVAL